MLSERRFLTQQGNGHETPSSTPQTQHRFIRRHGKQANCHQEGTDWSEVPNLTTSREGRWSKGGRRARKALRGTGDQGQLLFSSTTGARPSLSPRPDQSVPSREPRFQKKLKIQCSCAIFSCFLRSAYKQEVFNHCAGHTSMSKSQLWPTNHSFAITIK